jgi:hypothetical protein
MAIWIRLFPEMFHGFSSAQGMEWRRLDEFPDRLRIRPRVLPQRPPDGFVDKEFFGIEILTNDLGKQNKVCFILII